METNTEVSHFKELLGAVIVAVHVIKAGDTRLPGILTDDDGDVHHHDDTNDYVLLIDSEGYSHTFYHGQSCCENVWLESGGEELLELIGKYPITMAEEVNNVYDEDEVDPDGEEVWGSSTWTFIKIGTVKSTATMRWIGTSNGNYGEEPYYERLKFTPMS